MKQKEFVYRELAEFSKERLTQLGLSKTLGISLNTTNLAIKPLVSLGAVQVLQRGLNVIDKEKIVLFWANLRNLQKDIVYSTRVSAQPSEIEKNLSAGIIYTAYSAYKFRFGEVPADYSEVYVYSMDVEEIKKRFPMQKGPPNLFVLKADKRLIELSKENIAPNSQVFVDLWNLREWYAKEFVNALKERIL